MTEPPDPQDAIGYLRRGNEFARLARLSKALADYDKAIQLDPNSADTYLQRGKLYAKGAQLERALADYDKAILLEPKLGEAYWERSHVHRRQKNHDAAEADLSKAIEVDPEYAKLYYSDRASLYELQGDLEHVIADYSKLIEFDSQNASFYCFMRGNGYFKIGDFDRALADYDAAISLGQTTRAVFNNRAIAHMKKGDFERAIADFEETVEQILELDEARKTMSILDLGGFDMLQPDDASVYAIRGGIFFAHGGYTRALSDFEAALKSAPEHKGALAGQAVSLYALGKVSVATTTWRKLVDGDERYRQAEWFGAELGWKTELVEVARKVIATL